MRPLRATLVVTTLAATGLVFGSAAADLAVAHARDAYSDLDLLVRVLHTIETSYVDELPRERLVEAAIRGMVAELDAHSRYLDAEELAAFRGEDPSGVLQVGVGLQLADRDGAVTVTRVERHGPAARAGVAPGDVIERLDGKPPADAEQATLALLGRRGLQVLVQVRRGAASREITLLRDIIEEPMVEVVDWEGGLYYLRLSRFDDGASAQVEEALGKMPGLKQLIVDVRDNPGGLLSEALAVTDQFLTDGVIAATKGRLAHENATYEAHPGAIPADVDVTVLVNGLSASASEIFAGALQDAGRARLVGAHTWGKGTVQSLFETPDGHAVKLTVARWVSATGKPIAPETGRLPDLDVPWTVAGATAPDWDVPLPGRLNGDPQFDAAVADLRRPR
jgi:carboxyl-terminal processing protease